MAAKTSLSREQALGGSPVRLPVVSRVSTEEGGLRVTVELLRPRWQTALGAADTFERTFELDPIGRYVYELCDGKTSADAIARKFAKDKRIALPEARMAVASFLKTLVAKGLVAIAMKEAK